MSADAAAPTAPDVGRLALPTAVVAAAATGVAVLAFGRGGLDADALLAGGLAAVLVVLSAIDLRERRLPNVIVGPAIVAALAANALIDPDRLPEFVISAVVAGGFLLLPLLVSPNGIGMGDVKLAILLGAELGSAVITALVLAFVAVIPVAAYLFVRHGRAAQKATFPLGPFLAVGALAVILGPGLGG